jgi:cytochrome bd-type quinol oxidase subunit 2
MQHMLAILVALHVLAGVFWAGSTFAVARTGGDGAVKLFRPQMGAAVVTILAGGMLGHLVHEGGFGPIEHALAVGAVSAFIAFIVQGAMAGAAIAKLRRGEGDDAALRARVLLAHRIAAVLLLVATVAMAGSRYA